MELMEQMKNVVDGFSIGTLIGAFIGWLPSIAAVLSIIWTCLRIYETKTVQKWIRKYEHKQ